MTIYALSSGPGISGIAVVRVSGKDTSEVIKQITREDLPSPRVATLKKFNKNGGKELIDQGVVIWFPAPNSYTGEDLAEFHVHGSLAVIKSMQSAISKIKNCIGQGSSLTAPSNMKKLFLPIQKTVPDSLTIERKDIGPQPVPSNLKANVKANLQHVMVYIVRNIRMNIY